MQRPLIPLLLPLTLSLTLASCGGDRRDQRLVETAAGSAALPASAETPQPATTDERFSDKLADDLERARESTTRDAREFGTEVRKAATAVKHEASRAAGKSRELLDRAAAGLDSLADRADRGGTRTKADVDRTVARAHHALSSEHIRRAREAMSRLDTMSVRVNLERAEDHLDEAMDDIGEDIERRAADDIRSGIAATGRLASQSGDARAKVESALSALDREVERLGRKIDRR